MTLLGFIAVASLVVLAMGIMSPKLYDWNPHVREPFWIVMSLIFELIFTLIWLGIMVMVGFRWEWYHPFWLIPLCGLIGFLLYARSLRRQYREKTITHPAVGFWWCVILLIGMFLLAWDTGSFGDFAAPAAEASGAEAETVEPNGDG